MSRDFKEKRIYSQDLEDLNVYFCFIRGLQSKIDYVLILVVIDFIFVGGNDLIFLLLDKRR